MTIQDLNQVCSLKQFIQIYYSFGAGYNRTDLQSLLNKYAQRSIKHYSVDIENNCIYLYLYN